MRLQIALVGLLCGLLAACGENAPATVPPVVPPTQTPVVIVVTATTSPSTVTPVSTAPITMDLLGKSLHQADYSISGDKSTINFQLTIHNQTGHDLRAFTGVIHFRDLFDKEIVAANLTYTHPLTSTASVQWDGSINYNPYLDADVALARAALSDVHVQFVTQEVIYADGTRVPLQP